MEALIWSLDDKGIDFLQKVKNAETIYSLRNDASFVFPGKVQFLLDWLLNSLIKIGKFDDSNIDSKRLIFQDASVSGLILTLLRHGTKNNELSMLESRNSFESLIISVPFLVLLQMFMRISLRFNGASMLKNIFEMCELASTFYFNQLGANSTHFINLLEDSMSLLRVSKQSSNATSVVFKIVLKFLSLQDKKGSQLFLEKVFSLLDEFLTSTEDSGLAEDLCKFLATRGNLKDFEQLVKTAVGACGTLEYENMQKVLKAWKPETQSFFDLFLLKLFGSPSSEFICYFVFNVIADNYAPSEERVFLFNLFILLTACKPTFRLTALFLDKIRALGLYKHQNDFIFEGQTGFLKSLLICSKGSEQYPLILSVVVQLNFYIVLDESGSWPVSDHAFLKQALESSIEARQLPSVISKMVEMEIHMPDSVASSFARVSKPVVSEVAKILLSNLLGKAAVVYEIAHSFAAHSKFSQELVPLLKACFEHGHFNMDDSHNFIVSVLDRSPDLIQQYSSVRCKAELVDSLLHPEEDSFETVEVFSKLLPAIASTRKPQLLAALIQNAILHNVPKFIALFGLTEFYETGIVRHHLLSSILEGWDELTADEISRDRLCRLLSLLPREIFKMHTTCAAEISTKLLQAQSPLAMNAVATISSACCVKLDLELLKTALNSTETLRASDIHAMLVPSIQHYGIQAIIDIIHVDSLSNLAYCAPLYSLSSLEIANGKDISNLKQFSIHLLNRIYSAGFDDELITLLDSMANASIKLNMTTVSDRLYAILNMWCSPCDSDALSKVLSVLVKVSPPGIELTQLFALCLHSDATSILKKDSGKAAMTVLERMPLEEFKDMLISMASLENPAFDPVITLYLQRLLSSSDPMKCRLAFETACRRLCSCPLNLVYRVVLAKSIRPLTTAELGLVLQATVSQMADDFPTAIKVLSALQASYWHLLRQMLPAYIGVLMKFLDFTLLAETSSSHADLLSRLLTDLSEIDNGSTGLAYVLPSLILQYVEYCSSASEKCRKLQIAFLSLLKHFEAKPGKRERSMPIDHMARLARICSSRPDQRAILAGLFHEYKENFKYTGKA